MSRVNGGCVRQVCLFLVSPHSVVWARWLAGLQLVRNLCGGLADLSADR